MKYPLVSVAIPTYNSAETIEATLASIRTQTYPQSKIEVLIADGGSSDSTIARARKYKVKVIKNKKTDLVYGKYLAFLKAKGRYLIFIDSDEFFERNTSVEKKVKILNENKNIKAVIPSGYKTPVNAHYINDYINEFGDPFSYFVYKDSKYDQYLICDLKKNYPIIYEHSNYIVPNFSRKIPLIELWAGGCMIDLKYVKEEFLQLSKSPHLIAHIFYTLRTNNKLVSFTKNDATLHASCVNIAQYKRKLLSRIKNNVFATEMGKSGFVGRNRLSNSHRIRMLLFLPYSFSILFPIIDSLYLYVTRRKKVYLIHPYLTIYTAWHILHFYIRKLLHLDVQLRNYGS
jgi:glycosyltransferase involved in cell wall biosynthesis